jgi:uncharacterized membrane protein
VSSDLHELTKRNVQTIAQLEADAAKTGPHPVADSVTRALGSIPSIVVHVVVSIAWLLANTFLPVRWRFDPFPFSVLTIVLPVEALVVVLFILMSENRQRLIDERRASLGLQLNLLAEQENTRMLRLLSAIAGRVGIDVSAGEHGKALEENVRPEKVLSQIDEVKAETRVDGNRSPARQAKEMTVRK